MKLSDLANKYHLDISKYDPQQLILGFNIEKEHNENPETDVVNNSGDLLKIAMAHLDELPDYYTRLNKMEKESGVEEYRFVTEKELIAMSKLDEKAVSKNQQQLFGMALAYKRGELKNASKTVKDLADSMSDKKLKDFAKTKHKGLPEKVDEAKELFNVVAKRNGKLVKFNKKPLNRSEAGDLAADVAKAKIPSVDRKTLDIIPINEAMYGKNKFKADAKASKDLSKDEKSFTSWLEKNYQNLMKMSGDVEGIIAMIEKDAKSISMSDAKKNQYIDTLRKQKNKVGVQTYLTNAYMKGKGFGVREIKEAVNLNQKDIEKIKQDIEKKTGAYIHDVELQNNGTLEVWAQAGSNIMGGIKSVLKSKGLSSKFDLKNAYKQSYGGEHLYAFEILESLEKKVLKESIDRNIMQYDDKDKMPIIAQYEAMNKSGKVNMLDFFEVQIAAFQNGFIEFINFTYNDPKAYEIIINNYDELIKLVNPSDIPECIKPGLSYIKTESKEKPMPNKILKETISRIVKEETEHQKKFRALLDKFGVNSPDELDDEKKKEFFNAVDAGTKAKNESKDVAKIREMVKESLNEAAVAKGFNPKNFVSNMYKIQDLMDKLDRQFSDYDDFVDDVKYGDRKLKGDIKPQQLKNKKKLYKAFDVFKSELEIAKTQLRKVWPR